MSEKKRKLNQTKIFSLDPERNFTKIFFYGYERSIFLWNLSTFLFVDFLSENYVLATVITYLINRVRLPTNFSRRISLVDRFEFQIAVALRNSFGRRNLSKKTLIPKNFLI